MSRAVTIVWLTVLWMVLWRDAGVVSLAGGAVLALVLVSLGPRRGPAQLTVRPLATIRFLFVFAYKLVEANLRLAREVVTPRNRIETGIIGVSVPPCSDVVLALTANAVSLTPGTLTVEVGTGDDRVLYVHVLHLHDLDASRQAVLDIAQLARAAFDPGVRVPTAPAPEVDS